MSDWDFLHEMRDLGYSSKDIADAAGAGIAPWDWESVDIEWLDSELDGAAKDDACPAEQVEPFQSRDGFPYNFIEQGQILEDLVECARRHFENTGRYLQIWGELGEIYAEVRFGLRRHGSHKDGSDGTIAGRLVEVKTISPEKRGDCVLVKRQGNFEQLLIVRISPDFQFIGKLFDRGELKGKDGKYLKGRF